MQKNLFKMCMWIAMAVSSLSAQEAAASIPETKANGAQLEEQTFLVAPSDLYLNQEGIFVNVDGHDYTVRALTKHGDRWLATIVAGVAYCPEGHPTCKHCELCHKEKCRYFVRYCNQWN